MVDPNGQVIAIYPGHTLFTPETAKASFSRKT
jgi:hypothetical protein